MKSDIVRLLHVQMAIERILSYIADGVRDNKTEDAVIRQLEIIGEAVKHISATFKEQNPLNPMA